MYNRPLVVAEIGGNFLTFEKAALMIDLAAECGADAVKLQTYRAETVSSRRARFNMENTGDASQFELFKQFEIGRELHTAIFNYAKKKGIDCFTTPSHSSDVEMLESIGCSKYKIGSDDVVNLPFLRYIARIGKPIILGTGMSTMLEVQEAVDAILGEGNPDLTLLHAITAYPTHPQDVNLGAMLSLKREFPCLKVGYSDHTIGAAACIYAAALGADMLEKHFTYDKNADGPDHMLSADAKELREIIEAIRLQEILLGNGIKLPAKAEANTRLNNRKSVILTKNMKAGEAITRDCLEIKRPGFGIHPRSLDQLLGRSLARNMVEDDVLRWEDLR